jgi:endonuclease V-like protein UPF0215 family
MDLFFGTFQCRFKLNSLNKRNKFFKGKILEAKGFGAIKSEIRVLGIDDGRFVPHAEGTALVVGVVFRGGDWLDGVLHTRVEIDGFDSTERIALMINNSSHCKQLRLVMLNGITFAGFNVVDIHKLNLGTRLPVIAITTKKPNLAAVQKAINKMPKSDERWNLVVAAGEIHEISCRGKKLYVELAGINETDAVEIISLTSTRSNFPEPLRVAHLIASGVTP